MPSSMGSTVGVWTSARSKRIQNSRAMDLQRYSSLSTSSRGRPVSVASVAARVSYAAAVAAAVKESTMQHAIAGVRGAWYLLAYALLPHVHARVHVHVMYMYAPAKAPRVCGSKGMTHAI